MKERIRAFMDDLLKDIPKSRKVLELKEELIGRGCFSVLHGFGGRCEGTFQGV